MTPAAPHPDRPHPDPPQPDRAQPDPPQPDRAQPDRAQPDRAQPDSAQPDPVQPDPRSARPGEAPDRRARAERAVRGAFAAALALEAIMVLFVPRAIAQSGPGLTAGRLIVLLCLAGVLLVAAGLQRRRFGLPLGSALQLAVIATGLVATAMYLLGVIFGLVWIYLLRVRRDVLAR